MGLATFWFVVLVVVWSGFGVLEGFDFGVGMLHAPVGRDEVGREVALATIGPVWDGNEVWLIVAAAGTFAAFPAWYAAMLSGFYLVFLLLLVALIGRGVAVVYRGKRDAARWRRNWTVTMTVSGALAPLGVGIILADLLHGVPIGADQQFSGGITDLFGPYAVFTGVTFAVLCGFHGAAFLALRTAGDVRDRAVHAGRLAAPVAVVAVAGFVVWTEVSFGRGLPGLLAGVGGCVAAVAASRCVGRVDAVAFAGTSVALVGVVVSIFGNLYPRVMVATTGAADDLTVRNAASASYSLTVMTVVVAVFLPVVLAYQAWAYHLFRRRIRRADIA